MARLDGVRLPLWSLAFAFTLLVSPSSGFATLYRCEAADGSLHLTDRPPRNMRCRALPGSDLPATASRAPSRRTRSRGRRASRPNDTARFHRYDAYIDEAARLYQLPPQFIRAVVKVESNFHYDVVSRAGAMGLMQLMPRTARSMGVRDPFDPRQNILGGTRYLRILANRFDGDLVRTVAAYNAGEGAVERYGGIPPYAETQRYVPRVLRHYYAYLRGRRDA